MPSSAVDRVALLVERLGLSPHPERGWYKETFRAPLMIPGVALPHGADRAASTAIYFLVGGEHRATFLHRLRSDELFHLYEGGPLEVFLAGEQGARVERL